MVHDPTGSSVSLGLEPFTAGLELDDLVVRASVGGVTGRRPCSVSVVRHPGDASTFPSDRMFAREGAIQGTGQDPVCGGGQVLSWVMVKVAVLGLGVPKRALTAHRRPAWRATVLGTSRPGSVISPRT